MLAGRQMVEVEHAVEPGRRSAARAGAAARPTTSVRGAQPAGQARRSPGHRTRRPDAAGRPGWTRPAGSGSTPGRPRRTRAPRRGTSPRSCRRTARGWRDGRPAARRSRRRRQGGGPRRGWSRPAGRATGRAAAPARRASGSRAGGDHRRVEGRRDRQAAGPDSPRGGQLERLLDGRGRPGDHRLPRAVPVGGLHAGHLADRAARRRRGRPGGRPSRRRAPRRPRA